MSFFLLVVADTDPAFLDLDQGVMSLYSARRLFETRPLTLWQVLAKGLSSCGATVLSVADWCVQSKPYRLTRFLGKASYHTGVFVWRNPRTSLTVAGIFGAAAGLTYFVYSRFWKTQTAERSVYAGQGTVPFCTKCSPHIRSTVFSKATVGKRFLAPKACRRCALLPWLHGEEECEVHITATVFSTLSTFRELCAIKPRDVHTPFVNVMDTGEHFDLGTEFLQAHFGTLSTLENKNRWFWSEWTQSYMRCTPWRVFKTKSEELQERLAEEEQRLFDEAQRQRQEQRGEEDEEDPPPPLPPAHTYLQPGGVPADFTDLGGGVWAPGERAEPEEPRLAITDGSVGPEEVPVSFLPRQFSAIQLRRMYWDATQRAGGLLPQVLSLWGPSDNLQKLTGKKIQWPRPHTRVALTGAEPALYNVPPKGSVYGAVHEANAVAVGPLLTTPTVHHAKDGQHSASTAEYRMKVELDANGNPYEFHKDSETAKRYMKVWHALDRVNFTDARILQAYNELFGSKELFEVEMSTFGEEDKRRMHEYLQTVIGNIDPRKCNNKLELIEKLGKAPRNVVDNTLALLMMCRVITKIFEYLMYSEKMGLFYPMSIKGRDRAKVLDDFGRKFSHSHRKVYNGAPGQSFMDPQVAWEVDQTGMEKHERLDRYGRGLLAPVYKILQKISRVVENKLCGEFGRDYHAKLAHDREHGLVLNMKLKCSDKAKMMHLKLKFEDVFLDSGWALTSGCNFGVELTATFSCLTSNPEHVVAFNKKTQKFRIQEGTFDWVFESVPLYVMKTVQAAKKAVEKPEDKILAKRPVVLEGVFEGDDGGGQCSRIFSTDENNAIIVHNFWELGLCSKWKTILFGRVEIIGAHFAFKNGATDQRVPWSPALMRCVGKIGAMVSANYSREAAVARCLSLAAAFAGRNEAINLCFLNCAERMIDEIGEDWGEREVPVKEYDEVQKWLDAEPGKKIKLREVYDRAAVVMIDCVYPAASKQLVMVNNSVTEDPDSTEIGPGEWAKMFVLAEELAKKPLTREGWDEMCASFLPARMQ